MRVANKHTYRPESGDRVHYVGRPSPLGNPFSHRRDTLAEKVLPTRDASVHAYELWLRKRIDAGDVEVLKALDAIQEGDVLLCWCTPLSCHGDRIIKVLRELRAEVKEV